MLHTSHARTLRWHATPFLSSAYWEYYRLLCVHPLRSLKWETNIGEDSNLERRSTSPNERKLGFARMATWRPVIKIVVDVLPSSPSLCTRNYDSKSEKDGSDLAIQTRRSKTSSRFRGMLDNFSRRAERTSHGFGFSNSHPWGKGTERENLDHTSQISSSQPIPPRVKPISHEMHCSVLPPHERHLKILRRTELSATIWL